VRFELAASVVDAPARTLPTHLPYHHRELPAPVPTL
jgi:hypothetical protein